MLLKVPRKIKSPVKRSRIRPQETLRAIYTDRMQMQEEALKLYTDGSKTKEGVGLACVDGDFAYSQRISSSSSKYSPESYETLAALQHTKTAAVRNVTLITNFRSIIHGISRHNSTH